MPVRPERRPGRCVCGRRVRAGVRLWPAWGRGGWRREGGWESGLKNGREQGRLDLGGKVQLREESGVALRDVAKEESIRLEVFTGWEAKVGGASGGVRLPRIQEGPGVPQGTGGEGPRGPRC